MNTEEYITLEEFCEKNKWITSGGLNWLIKESCKIDELSAVFRDTKRGILIDEEKFFEYYNSIEGEIDENKRKY